MLEVAFHLIACVAPAIALASVVVPFWMGARGARATPAVGRGWALLVLAYLFWDLLSPAIAEGLLGEDFALRLAVDQPGTIGAVCVGWLAALFWWACGTLARIIVQSFRRKKLSDEHKPPYK